MKQLVDTFFQRIIAVVVAVGLTVLVFALHSDISFEQDSFMGLAILLPTYLFVRLSLMYLAMKRMREQGASEQS